MNDCKKYIFTIVKLIPKTICTGIYKYKNMEYRYSVKERCGPSLKLCF